MHMIFATTAFALVLGTAFSLDPVPQGFPVAWDGDRYYKYPGQVVQQIPSWLDGYLFCQTCASYGDQSKPKGQKVAHMFDAIGALAQIEITPNYTTYTGAYYPSKSYKIWNFYGRDWTKSSVPTVTSFSSYNVTMVKQWKAIPSDAFDYVPNVDFWKIGQNIVAETESYAAGMTFDVETTTKFRQFPFKDATPMLQGQPLVPIHMPIHERIDPDTGIIYSSTSAMNPTAKPPTFHQVVYSIDDKGVRTVEGVYDYGPFDQSLCKENLYTGDKKNFPRYMHAISSTQRYVVLPLTSGVLNPCPLFKQGPPYPPDATIYDPKTGIDWIFGYEKSVPIIFLLFDKKEKKFLPPIEAPSHMWASHASNAYELTDKKLVVDLITYDDEVYKATYVDILTQPSEKWLQTLPAHATRFQIDLDNKTVTNSSFLPEANLLIEFPQFNHKFEGKKYKYTYAVLDPYFANNTVIKIDMDDASGKNNKFFNPPGPVSLAEPWFVAKPNAVDEDDGVIIMRGLDPTINKTRVYIVDAKTMQQVGELLEPVLTPFGFHERFYSKESLGIKPSKTS